MSNIDYIVSLCFELSEQGKTPSVALVRNTSQHSLAIPEVIKGIQLWKSNSASRPNISNKPIETVSENKKSLQQRVTQLEEQVALIMQKLANISDEKKL